MATEYIEKIVDVTLSYGTITTTGDALRIPLFLAKHHIETDKRILSFSNTRQLTEYGFSPNSPAYRMVSLALAGNSRPPKVLLGRIATNSYKVNFEVKDNAMYLLTLRSGSNYKNFTYTTQTGAVAGDIAQGFADLIAQDIFWNTVTNEGVDGDSLVFDLIEGTSFDISGSDNVIIEAISTEEIMDSLAQAEMEDANYVWLATQSHDEDDMEALADYAQTNDKIYVAGTQSEDVRNKVAGNIAQRLALLGYTNTHLFYDEDADNQLPEAAIIGSVCGTQAGLTTAHGKTLFGLTAKSRPYLVEKNLTEQNVNYYRIDNGRPFYRDGLNITGDFLDTVHHALWSKLTINDSIFNLIKNKSMQQSKIPFTTDGILMIEQAIRDGWLNVGISNGTIANEVNKSLNGGKDEDLRPTIFIPSRADAPSTDVARRLLDGIFCEYVYNGGINYVRVRVNVLVDR